ncbi:MAG: YebC/PmpR family DNA-binding transcriptional regulator [Deltaproteobacteria bacterium]|nr:YebC/PmpR family DNA-binding transcriptional regulator [Deltaproteobacteria bacterium]
MSGHSKWSTIKRKKGAADAKRGKVFTRLIKEITVAARMGGGDPVGNSRLRTAIANAKAQNMPKDNIDRAIKKGTGELAGVTYEEVIYEGYAPGGVAVLVEALTDNKNRTVSDVRYTFGKFGGSLGGANSVAYLFAKKGQLTFAQEGVDEEQLMETALEAGAEDVRDEDEVFEVITEPGDLESVREALTEAGMEPESAELAMIPSTTVALDAKQAASLFKLLDAFDELDDVQNVWSNAELPEGFEGV